MRRRFLNRLPLGIALVAASLAVSVSSASAAITLGSSLSTEPDGSTSCSQTNSTRGCLAIDTFLPGRELVAPSTGQITSWHVRLGAGTEAQSIRIRIVRQISATEFQILSSGPLENVPTGAGTYTFSAQLPIATGDQVGLEAGSGSFIEWRAPLVGAQSSEYGAIPDDQLLTGPPTFTNPDQEHAFNAVLDPTNSFTVGEVTRNKKKGTATLSLTLPNPGELIGAGKGVKVASAAVTSKSVGAGQTEVVVKAKGKKKRKLNDTGKVTVKPKITYTPTGGDPRSQSVKVKLKKRRP